MSAGKIRSNQVAKSVPFDNSTVGAVGLSSTELQSVIEELFADLAGKSGVVPCFFFGRASGGGAGTYLQINGVASNRLGQIISGTNKIVRLTVTTAASISNMTGAVIQLQQRTAVSTYADIAGAAVTIPMGQYRASATISVNLATDAEISAYIKSGSTSDIQLQVYVAPQ